jgi:NADPH-dependent 2,4-dienoyl-CoA reductase/sulfur reductase-like enzyme
MPASHSEVEEAIEEGVKMEFLAAPKKVLGKNGTLSLESFRMKLGEPDASGRRRADIVKGSEFSVDVDTIIVAVGQRPEIPEKFDLRIGAANTVVVDVETLATSKKGVFAAGDVVTGPASVVQAIAVARTAAIAIDKYLGGKGLLPVEEVKVSDPTSRHTFLERWQQKDKRVEMPKLATGKRLQGFDEVELGLSQAMAVAEGQRCWRCDLEE